MIKSYFKIAWRNLSRNKGYSFINISGLALGMAVSIVIGMWMHDELTFNQYFKNHERIGQVMQHYASNGKISSGVANPGAMAEGIRDAYGSDFKYVLQSSWNYPHTLTYGEKMFLEPGSFFEPDVTYLLSLKMLKGSMDGLKKDMNSILLSESVAQAYFGDDDPLDKIIRVDNASDVKVTGVYQDIPENTSFKEMKFILPWNLYLSLNPWIAKMENPWGSSFSQTFVQLADNANIEKVSARIKDVRINNLPAEDRVANPIVFLHPMQKWHLYSEFENGVNVGGSIRNVWLFAIIGVVVLILACINFMNLSTARSEKRSKEVGIRKSIGSARRQLIAQFFCESIVVSLLAFIFALIFVLIATPSINSIADKKMNIPWGEPLFWLAGLGFSGLTGIVAGLYPALFLSAFQPIKVLKGTFRVGRAASLPRQVLVVMQFTISITLIIGTAVVYRQIEHGQQRPIGYNRDGLITILLNEDRYKHFDAIRTESQNEGAVIEMAKSSGPTTEVWNSNNGFDWEGKDPNQALDFPNTCVSYEYGKTIGWEIKEGRDFSREFVSDSSALILNESAVAYIGMKDPVGKDIRWGGKPFKIIGVVKDLLVQSPYQPVRPSIFNLTKQSINVIVARLNPQYSTQDALSKIENVFKKYNPTAPFQSTFVDEEFARKFGDEKRVATVAGFFAALAILISCLGLFGLASFVAEQRTKEIGIRKVLGASVTNLWSMLSKDFVALIILSWAISVPLAWYGMNIWLDKYEYRTSVSWWIFAISGSGALLITLFTVSFHAVRAALINPAKSLRSE